MSIENESRDRGRDTFQKACPEKLSVPSLMREIPFFRFMTETQTNRFFFIPYKCKFDDNRNKTNGMLMCHIRDPSDYFSLYACLCHTLGDGAIREKEKRIKSNQ
jgi:hypothetical protein